VRTIALFKLIFKLLWLLSQLQTYKTIYWWVIDYIFPPKERARCVRDFASWKRGRKDLAERIWDERNRRLAEEAKIQGADD
jgi:hypothetical protein